MLFCKLAAMLLQFTFIAFQLFVSNSVLSWLQTVQHRNEYLKLEPLCARKRSNLPRQAPPAKVQHASETPPKKNSVNSVINRNEDSISLESLWQEIDKFETLTEDGDGVKATSLTLSDLNAELAKDFQELSKSAVVDKPYNNQTTKDSGATKAERSTWHSASKVITKVLIADFFVVVAFLLWFVVAVVLQSSYPVVLERFQDVFQPVVVPALTVLMVGSIASGVAENIQKRIEEGSRSS